MKDDARERLTWAIRALDSIERQIEIANCPRSFAEARDRWLLGNHSIDFASLDAARGAIKACRGKGIVIELHSTSYTSDDLAAWADAVADRAAPWRTFRGLLSHEA